MLYSKSDLLIRGHRQLLVISGNTQQTIAALSYQLTEQLKDQPPVLSDDNAPGYTSDPCRNWLWLGPDCPTHDFQPVSASRIQSELGTESHLVVINAHSHFNADATVALAGTLLPGSLLVLLTPPLSQWPSAPHPFAASDEKTGAQDTNPPRSHYLQRLCSFIYRMSRRIPVHESPRTSPEGIEMRLLNYKPTNHPSTKFVRRTTFEQNRLIEDIIKMTTSGNPSSLFVTADRGRGKSAALGIAAAGVVNRDRGPVCVIAPTRRAVSVLYRHFQLQLKQTDFEDNLRFLPPDQINHVSDDTRLILVDEAAGIPISLLGHIQSLRIPTVYSSTVDGYEGAGRGFAIRFMQALDASSEHVRTRQLQEPIRWAANDPLEQFCNSALMLSKSDHRLLKTSQLFEHAEGTNFNELSICELTQIELAGDESLLEDVFGLLLQAHYRTCPHDLWHLMDGPNLRVFVARVEKQLVGAALVATEGPIQEPQLRHGIMMRSRRPKGHVLPQLLSQYTMNSNPLDMTIARVVRIAVLPALHRLGIGTRLIQKLESFYRPGSLDAIGAMFGGAPETINFWRQVGYRCCHLSAGSQTSIGYRSVCMLLSLSDRAARIQSIAEVLHNDIGTHLKLTETGEPGSTLAYKQQLIIESGRTDPVTRSDTPITAPMYDLNVVGRYINGTRSLSDSRCAIARLIKLRLYKITSQGVKKTGVTSALMTQHGDAEQHVDERHLKTLTLFVHNPEMSMTDLATNTKTSGKKEAESLLRSSLAHLVQLDTTSTLISPDTGITSFNKTR